MGETEEYAVIIQKQQEKTEISLEQAIESAAAILLKAAESFRVRNPNTVYSGFGLQVLQRRLPRERGAPFNFGLERPAPVAFRITAMKPLIFESKQEGAVEGVADVLSRAGGGKNADAVEVFKVIFGAISRKHTEWKLEIFFDGFVEVSLRTSSDIEAPPFIKREEKNSEEGLKKVFRQVIMKALADER